ncbi:MAG: hypothetical protein KAQ98_07535 [Bacteriovoracaceae bacterium]|nr:hypothetical protein [Bacteriovoracaceae bacterium]
MTKKITLLAISFLLITSCSHMGTLNRKKHVYGKQPKKIIWIQIAGLDEEHVAMLRFNYPDENTRTSFEESTCIGKIWNYNLYNLRPAPYQGFISQIVGRENIKNSCADYGHRPIWSYLHELGYDTGIFESVSAPCESLDRAWNCGKEGKIFYENIYFWKMGRASMEEKLFHFQDKHPFVEKGIYYDKTCQSGTCFASISSNVGSIFKRFSVGKTRYLFIIRDFSYFNALKNKKIGEARSILGELDKMIAIFQEKTKQHDDILILVTSSGTKNFEFPEKGREWAEFESKGEHVLYRKSSLLSPVFSTGAGSENFCGFYKEVEIFKRLLFIEKRKRIIDWF